VLGLVQFRLTGHRLGAIGLQPSVADANLPRVRLVLLVSGLLLIVAILALWTGALHVDPIGIARGTTYAIVVIALVYFVAAFGFFGLTAAERRRMALIVVLFLAAALFWAGFEQTGSTFNLFAERYTQRTIPGLVHTIPAGWFQSLGAVFVIVLAPLIAALWVWLAHRQLNPAAPVKFALGLLLLAAGFGVMAYGARWVAAGAKVAPYWLVTTYFLHSVGELCLSPVGLSSVTQLAPRRLVSQMLGVWFLASSLGNLLAGLIAGRFSADAVAAFPGQYLKITLLVAAGGLVLLALAPRMTRLATPQDPPA
jgi:proton-dependent oligopeptide transporter, POT family